MWAFERLRDPSVPMTDKAGAGAPGRTVVSLGGDHIDVLTDAALVAVWEGRRLVVQCELMEDGRVVVDGYSVGAAPHRVLQEVLDHARGPINPYRGRVVEVTVASSRPDADALSSVQLRGLPVPAAERSELVLDERIWRELDVNVGGLFARAATLERLGLGTTRGVLLAGPPGVGKTHAFRVLTAELAGRVTVLLVPSEPGERLAAVYEYARLLSPTLVVIEDIDLVAGTTRASGARLHALLESLDGLMNQHGQVVTLATTNRVEAMDESVRRAARFDRIIPFDPPPLEGRRRILRRYLAPLGREDLDIDHLAAISGGATGADLREVVRHAVLESDGELTTSALVDAVRARDLYAPGPTAYL